MRIFIHRKGLFVNYLIVVCLCFCSASGCAGDTKGETLNTRRSSGQDKGDKLLHVGDESYKRAVQKIFSLSMTKKRLKSYPDVGLVIMDHLSKVEILNGDRYWSISLFDNYSDHVAVWNRFLVGVDNFKIMIYDPAEGEYHEMQK